MTDTHWPDYYAVTVDRPAWGTVTDAIARFAAEDGVDAPPRLAVDLGCGAGRDARELLPQRLEGPRDRSRADRGRRPPRSHA